MKNLVRIKGKRGKPKILRGKYWEVQFLYRPVVRVIFSFTNSIDDSFSTFKVSVWDFYGKTFFNRVLLGEFLLEEKFPPVTSAEDGEKLFEQCLESYSELIEEKVEDIVSSAPGFVKYKWNKEENSWYKLRVVNGSVVSKERVMGHGELRKNP